MSDTFNSNSKCSCGAKKVDGYTWDTIHLDIKDTTKIRRSVTHNVSVCTQCHRGENGEPGKPYAELFITL